MSQIYISRDTLDKLKESSKDDTAAMLLSKFSPKRQEKSKYSSIKAERKTKRMSATRKDGKFNKNDKDRQSYEKGEISLETYKKRKLAKTAQSLASQLKEIRIKKGLERRKIRHVRTKGLGYSNQSVFRSIDKDPWPYRK